MNRDPLDWPATPWLMRAMASQACLSERALRRALELASSSPEVEAWRRFLARTFLGLGAILVLSGVVYFFAFNWEKLGRFAKFGLIEVGIAGCAVAAWRLLPRLGGRIALAAASVLVGPLLAVYGQTYQTGADPFELFGAWAALIAPWVAVAMLPGLWLVFVALLNTATTLYWTQIVVPTDLSRLLAALTEWYYWLTFNWATTVAAGDLSQFLVLPLLLAAINGLALIGYELQARRASPWMAGRWLPRLLALLTFAPLLASAIAFVFNPGHAGAPGLAGLAAFATALGAIGMRYFRHTPELFMLTTAAWAAMVFATAAFSRFVFEALELEEGGLLVIGLFVVGELALVVPGLWRVARRRTLPYGDEA